MNISSNYPSQEDATKVVALITNEKTLSSMRMTTGEQYFVYAVKTVEFDYVIRMTFLKQRHKFISGIYWQEKLIPLDVPLAKFIQSDLNGKYSPFSSLLMKRLPGYGFADSYEQELPFKSWYDFLMNRLRFFVNSIKQNEIFDVNEVMNVISILKNMETELKSIRPTPFLYDASERNVLVYDGKISGIVDVDDMCFGDPLLVLALTYVALEIEKFDTLYCDYWAEELKLDHDAKKRLAFYRLLYTVMFMHKQAMDTYNCQTINFDVQQLKDIFQQSLLRMKEFEL